MANLLAASTGEDPVRRARARASRIRDGIHAYLATLGDIARAWQDEDWRHLKYESWDAYVDGEYGKDRLRLTTEHRQKAVQELRLAGLSQRAIATAVNEPRHVVRTDLGSGRPRPLSSDSDRSPNSPALEPEVESAPLQASFVPASPHGDGSGVGPSTSPPVEDTAVGVGAPGGISARAKAAANKALLESVTDDALRDHQYMTKFVHAVARVTNVAMFDPDRVSDLADDDQLLQLSTALDSLTRFTEKVRRRRSGLRLVQGGAS